MTPLVGPDGISPVSSIQPGDAEPVSPFLVTVVFNRETGLGTIKMRQPGGTVAFHMTPMEARMLGADLMVKSEGAICYALTMRCLTEPSMGNMPITEAVQVIDVLGRATRQAHAIAESAHAHEEREKATHATQQSDVGKTPAPEQVPNPDDSRKD